MKDKIVKITKEMVVFNTENFKEKGDKIDLEVELPKEINLDSFSINGTITDCRHIRDNGSTTFMIEMDIDELPLKNRLILDAYIDFLERERILNKIKKENIELQMALTNLGEKLSELIAVSEFLIRQAEGNQKLH